jgi:hypothetical protein
MGLQTPVNDIGVVPRGSLQLAAVRLEDCHPYRSL